MPIEFLQLCCPVEISPMENLGCFPGGKASCDRVAPSNQRCMLGVFKVSVIHRTLTVRAKSRLPVIRADSANQNVTNSIMREKPED